MMKNDIDIVKFGNSDFPNEIDNGTLCVLPYFSNSQWVFYNVGLLKNCKNTKSKLMNLQLYYWYLYSGTSEYMYLLCAIFTILIGYLYNLEWI